MYKQTYLCITMFVVKMRHKGESFPFHIITTIPLASYFFTPLRAMDFTNMHVHLICRLKFTLSEKKKKKQEGHKL